MLCTPSLTTDAQLPARLQRALRGSALSYGSARMMSPELSYSRHRGPAPPSARAAAVLMLLFRRGLDWQLPLTVRPDTLAHHRGQISLPGGLLEPGETSQQAALRELEEELGRQRNVRVLGQLPKCYVFASNCDVTPWVAAIEGQPTWQPNPAEVTRVIEMPLNAISDNAHLDKLTIRYGALSFQAPCYRVGDDRVWGATAVMLSELATVMFKLTY